MLSSARRLETKPTPLRHRLGRARGAIGSPSSGSRPDAIGVWPKIARPIV